MRVLQVVFESPDEFGREHRNNLANGGVFVASVAQAELREAVEVEIALPFCDASVRLQGEIVHIVPPEMESAGATPGVAVQFQGSPVEVRDRLAPLVQACGDASQGPQAEDQGRRKAPRRPARVPVRIDGQDEGVDGRTRNLSQSGVLVEVPGNSVSVGQRVRVTLENPTTGESMEVDGTVAREVETAGDVAAVGIAFDPPSEARPAVEKFVEDVQTAEHARRLGGIKGAIEELGPQSLLQMFGVSAPAGTLVLRRGEQEGSIGFEGGLLRYVQLGGLTGMKALVRLLSWRDGVFEFHARLENAEVQEAPLPLEAALFDAVRQIDEGERIDASQFPPHAKVSLSAAADGREHTKVESAVIDLAGAGFTVQRILDVIPEPDPEILWAFATLAEDDAIRFDD